MRHLLLLLAGITPAIYGQDAETPSWTGTGSLITARQQACAVTLADGRVLIAGGRGLEGRLASTEIYDKSQGQFVPGPPMGARRAGHSCTLLNDGRVLVAGGDEEGAGTAEIYSAEASTWASAGAIGSRLERHTATLLSDGRVLLAGGSVLGLFDVGSDQIFPLDVTLQMPREEHAAVLLPSGSVLVVGGRSRGAVLRSTEVFDPVELIVKSGPELNSARAGHSATRLPDDRILIVAGTDGTRDLATGEILAEEGSSWTALTAQLRVARRGHLAVIVPGTGGVLIAGGFSNEQTLASTELFQPGSDTFTPLGDLTVPRGEIASASLEDGVVLAMGGVNENGPQRGCGLLLLPIVRFDKAIYISGETAFASGSQFPLSATTATATLTLSDSPIQQRLLSPSIRLTSIGQTSGFLPTPIVRTESSDQGKRLRLTVSPGAAGAIATASVRTRTTIRIAPPTPVFVGQEALIPVALTRDSASGPMTGTIVLTFGGRLAFGDPITFLLATADVNSFARNFARTFATSGAGTITATYSGDSSYAPSSTTIEYTVFNRRVSFESHDLSFSPPILRVGAAVTMAISVDYPVQVPAAPLPAALITFSLSGTVIGQSALTPTARAGTLVASVSFTPLTPGVIRITANFPGDGFYPAETASRTALVSAALSTLSFVGSPSPYPCMSLHLLNVRLEFPTTVGIGERRVEVGQMSGSTFIPLTSVTGEPIVMVLTPSPSPGVATASRFWNLPPGLTSLTARYLGDATVSASTVTIPMVMEKLLTSMQLTPAGTTATNPATFTATMTTNSACVVGVQTQGVIQFFDGTALLASRPVTVPGVANATVSTSQTVSRPVGARTITVKYAGDSVRAPSEISRSITFQ